MKEHPRRLVTVETAVDIIMHSIRPLPAETIPLSSAGGRVLSGNIVAAVDIPGYDNSAMDGFAVRAADVAGATRERPVSLRITGEIRAGGGAPPRLDASGSTVRIMTGAPIPPGADAVVMVEDTAERDDVADIYAPVDAGANIRRAGEDIPSGRIVLLKGDRLRSSEIGLLASLNIAEVSVARRPRVAVISTGDEVTEVGEPLRPGTVRNSNAYILGEELRRCGAEATYLGIARDDSIVTGDLIEKALAYDCIVTTGGVSMGEYDFVRDTLAAMGFDILIETIRMKPGKPCVFGRKGSTLFFGLPGNPVSTQVSFLQFVRPAVLSLMGARRIAKPVVLATLDEAINKKPDRTHFIRGVFTVEDGEFRVRTTGPQGSGILTSMSEANCLIILPVNTSHAAPGDRVTIQLIGHDEI